VGKEVKRGGSHPTNIDTRLLEERGDRRPMTLGALGKRASKPNKINAVSRLLDLQSSNIMSLMWGGGGIILLAKMVRGE
jgi:hypothetical protein